MSREIHVIIKDGKPWYREWSTVVDAYVTTPTPNLAAFKELLYETELKQFKAEFECLFPKRIERALKHGTSHYFSSSRSFEEWEKSMAERQADGEFDSEAASKSSRLLLLGG